MGIKYISNLPSPEEIIDKYPLSKELEAKKKEFDKEVEKEVDEFINN